MEQALTVHRAQFYVVEGKVSYGDNSFALLAEQIVDCYKTNLLRQLNIEGDTQNPSWKVLLLMIDHYNDGRVKLPASILQALKELKSIGFHRRLYKHQEYVCIQVSIPAYLLQLKYACSTTDAAMGLGNAKGEAMIVERKYNHVLHNN